MADGPRSLPPPARGWSAIRRRLTAVPSFTIGGLARAAGVNVETIRFYERRGVLPLPERSPGGYRRYGQMDLWRLQFIRRGQRLGFTLSDIAELLRPGGGPAPGQVLELAHFKLRDTEEKLEALAGTRDRLHRLISACGEGGPDCVNLQVGG